MLLIRAIAAHCLFDIGDSDSQGLSGRGILLAPIIEIDDDGACIN